LFVDFSGMTMGITNRDTGEITQVQILLLVPAGFRFASCRCLGGSDYPFVKALSSQTKKDFINVHVDMFKYFGGVPAILVPDNLKSAVLKADNYDPELNPDYVAMSRHYGCVIIDINQDLFLLSIL
jgi:hypothetical protein